MALIITEKPSVAQDIAHALNTPIQKHEGYLTTGPHIITWAYGHLLALASPESYTPTWKSWNWTTLPMLPDPFKIEPLAKTKKQLHVIATLIKKSSEIICATDADREGELIFRLIYQYCGQQKPVQRLWLSENTSTAIQHALNTLKPSTDYDNLGRAAESRSQADWLVGLNATRAFTLTHGQGGQGALSVGRVQTPTLRLIADRDREIAEFTAVPYWQLAATFSAPQGTYVGIWFKTEGKDTIDRILDESVARALANTFKQGIPATITHLDKKIVTIKPPLLFNLNELQKEANRRFGITAQHTLDTAQSLYEKHLTSYPRTQSQYITADVAATITPRLSQLSQMAAYREFIALIKHPIKASRLINEKNVAQAGHYAVIPTGTVPHGLTDRESKIFDIIIRRFIGALLPAGKDERTTVITEAQGELFRSRGTAVVSAGWRVVQPLPSPTRKKSTSDDGDKDTLDDYTAIPAGLVQNQDVLLDALDILAKQTKPPARLNDASLLNLMEKHGLGTPATRARMVEVLLTREYITRDKKALVTTEKGQNLLKVLPDAIQSPKMTGQWEQRLESIAQGTHDAQEFLTDIRAYINELVSVAHQQPRTAIANTSNLGECPVCHQGRVIAGKKAYGCSQWQSGCRLTIWRTLAGKRLSEAQVKTLLSGQQTSELKGFKSKNGKSFSARLALDTQTGQVTFHFSQKRRGPVLSSKEGG